MKTTNYQGNYTNEYNYLTDIISAKNTDPYGMPVNPYMTANFGNGMPLPLGIW